MPTMQKKPNHSFKDKIRKFTIFSSSIAIIISTGVALTLSTSDISDELDSSHTLAASAVADNIASYIEREVDIANDIANNPVTIIAMEGNIDDKKRFSSSILKTINDNKNNIAIIDTEHRTIFGNTEISRETPDKVDAIEESKNKRTKTMLVSENEGKIYTIHPIFKSDNFTVSGFAITEIDADNIIRKTIPKNTKWRFFITHNEKTIAENFPSGNNNRRVFSTPISLPAFSHALMSKTEIPGNTLHETLLRLTNSFIISLTSALLFIWLISDKIAKALTRRLNTLSRILRNRNLKSSDIPTDETNDEIGYLTLALKTSINKQIESREKLEELVKKRTQRLSENHKVMELSSQIGGVGGWVFSTNNNTTKWTEKSIEMLNLDESNPPSRNILHRHTNSSKHDTIRDNFDSVFYGKQEANSIFPITDKNGKTIWIAEKIVRIGNDIVGAILDITERKTRDSELKAAIQNAEAANMAKSRFLANMSHEIRTPMNGILGMAQLIEDPKTTSEEKSEFAKTIISSGEVLMGILNEILDLSKIEAGKTTLESIPFDAKRILDDINKIFSKTAESKQLTFAFTNTDSSCDIIGDPVKFRQIISNLVSNAIKFTEKGTISLSMKSEKKNEKTSISVTVTDTGQGMTEETIAKLFTPFTQADETITRRFGGTGLGLAISQNFAKLMGGNIAVESLENFGSVFTFSATFDSAISTNITKQIEQTNDPAKKQNNTTQETSLRILVVDDNDTNKIVMKTFFKKLGLTAEYAEDGTDAVDAVSKTKYDIIFMDIQMPKMDGYTATQKIREMENGKTVFITALTADAYAENVQQALDSGMDMHISKPINVQKIKNVINQIKTKIRT